MERPGFRAPAAPTPGDWRSRTHDVGKCRRPQPLPASAVPAPSSLTPETSAGRQRYRRGAPLLFLEPPVRMHHGRPQARVDPSPRTHCGARPSRRARARRCSCVSSLDQEAVDRIVWAMVVAGLEKAVELAQVAIDETGFGVFEDKVVKNYVATEFLYDFLKDKKSVGVIGEDPERNIQYVAEPIGVVLAILPVTNPTSTVLFKAIVAAKTRNAIIFRPSPRAIRCALHTVEILRKAAEEAGMPPDALQVIPDAPREATHYLFEHPGIDLIWTTGGPRIVNLANKAGKPVISVGPGNAPVYLHRTADLRGAIVDILISKTFDASVICPAEQTCVIDDAVWEPALAEFQRMGARLLSRTKSNSWRELPSSRPASPTSRLSGNRRSVWRRWLALGRTQAQRFCWRPSHQTRELLARTLSCTRSSCRYSGRTRSLGGRCTGGVRSRDRARRPWPHLRDLRPRTPIIERYSTTMRTGRILVNAPTAVGLSGESTTPLRRLSRSVAELGVAP